MQHLCSSIISGPILEPGRNITIIKFERHYHLPGSKNLERFTEKPLKTVSDGADKKAKESFFRDYS